MALHEYIITLKNREDLDSFYQEMETIVPTEFLPIRSVPVHNRRPISRNTHYLLSEDEAESIKYDPRVLGITLAEPLRNSIKLQTGWKTSSTFNKGSDIISPEKNWGLLRCTKSSNINGWGMDNSPTQNATVDYATTGVNVDVVVIDGYVNPLHPELQVNANGSGGTRVKQFDWYSLNSIVVALTNTTDPLRGKYSYPNSFPSTPESAVELPKKIYPDREGYYWAKFDSAQYWQIAQVYGDLQFLQIIAFSEIDRNIIKMSSDCVKEWGPRFERYNDNK